jgi:anti-sigma B factor antagonist
MSIAEDAPFELAVDAAPGQITIRLRGELDLATVPGFAEAVREAEGSGVLRVLIDLRELRFIDSSGVGELLRTADRANRNGHSVELLRSEGPVEQTFRMMGVADMLPRAA